MTRRIDKYYLISENLDNYRKEVRERALNNPLLIHYAKKDVRNLLKRTPEQYEQDV